MQRFPKFSVHVSAEAYVAAAAMLLLVPLQWAVAWITAAMVHEVCHCLALRLCGHRIENVRVNIGGALIKTGPMTDVKTMVCALAGPAGGMLLLLFAARFPRLAICAFVQSAFNLLPVFPLDGGRALRSLLRILFSENLAGRIYAWVEMLVVVFLFFLLMKAFFAWKLGLVSVICALLFLLRTEKIKIPCKSRFPKVQ